MDVKLHLWVENQLEGAGHDCTRQYIEAARWTAPEGVDYDPAAQTMSGPAEEAWEAYRSLSAAVAEAGHGGDVGPEDAGEPSLTACPVELISRGYTSAAESLARMESTRAATWEEFAKAAMIPA